MHLRYIFKAQKDGGGKACLQLLKIVKKRNTIGV